MVCRPSSRLICIALGLLHLQGVYASDQEIIHIAKAGDTLIGLERDFLAPPYRWQGLQTLNRVENPRRIPVGTTLRIPEKWLRIEPQAARVLAYSGSVTLDGRPLSADARVTAGAVLRTGAGGFVTLAMPDQSRLTVQPDSEARLEKIQAYKGISGLRTQIHLEQGRVETTVTPQRGPAARYQIRTPTASLSVRGTAFRVGADPDAHTAQAEVTHGEVAINTIGRDDESRALPAGYGVVARPGAPIPAAAALLPAPQLSAPAVIEQTEISIPIPPVPGAVGYRSLLARDDDFRDMVASTRQAAPRADYTDLPDGHYLLRVRAIDAAGLEGLDSTVSFELRARPTPPRPANDGSLSWTPRPDSSKRFRVQIAATDDFARLALERDTDDLSLAPALPSGRHVWRVASLRPDGQPGPWSPPSLLQVDRLPGPASLEVFNNRLRFSWPQEPGQIYDVQLASDETFGMLIQEENIGEAAVTWPTPAPGTYYLRLRARDPAGTTSPWSETQTLRPRLPLPTWILSSPGQPHQ